MKNIISLFLLVSTLQAAEVPAPLLKAIHQVETNGRFEQSKATTARPLALSKSIRPIGLTQRNTIRASAAATQTARTTLTA